MEDEELDRTAATDEEPAATKAEHADAQGNAEVDESVAGAGADGDVPVDETGKATDTDGGETSGDADDAAADDGVSNDSDTSDEAGSPADETNDSPDKADDAAGKSAAAASGATDDSGEGADDSNKATGDAPAMDDEDAAACAEALESLNDVAPASVAAATAGELGDETVAMDAVDAADGDEAGRPVPETESEAEETIAITDLPADASLTRELPGKGSAPAVDETIAIGDIPLPSVPSAQEAEARHRRMSPRRRRAVVALAIVAAVAAGGAGYAAWNAYQAQAVAEAKVNAHTMMSVKIGIKAPGLKSSSGTKIPVEVSGQDTDGTAVSETAYVDEHGRGLKLLPGDYTLSIAASPIAADGTIYTVPTTKAKVTVKSDGQDLSAAANFKLKVPSAETVTDEQIASAGKYAEEGGCSSASVAKVLEQAATARRDAAASSVDAAKAQTAREADARHKATDLYQLDIPVEWYGKVATWQNGTTLCIYLAGDTSTPLVTLSTVDTGQAFTPDDGDSVLGSVDLGNGYTVYASGPVYPYVIAQTINGRTNNPVDTYSMDSAVELVELTTGNRYTYDQIKNDLVGKSGKADKATKLETDYLAQILLPSIKAED